MKVTAVEPHGFRNLADGKIAIGEAISVVHGPNGSGKTNLLEAVFFGLTSHACRGGADRDLIAHEQATARVGLEFSAADGPHELLASLGRDGERRRMLDGSPGPAAERPLTSLFLPDRLQIVKGPPAQRRGHLDRFIAALWPARADLRQRFGRALAQRNALVSRVKAGLASADSLAAWDEKLAAEAEPLIAARSEASGLLSEPFASTAAQLGLPPASIRYRPRGPASAAELVAELGARRAADLGRAYTSFGPQLDELATELGERPIRRFGSQGQQRLALLALLLAEREVLIAAGRPAPLMLLDDVMSELDADHRALLVERLGTAGQAVITATEPGAVPDSVPWTSLEMRAGRVRAVGGPLKAVA
ncbi:MAG: DNA replication/repair protein RecF [Solirubrobacterales bacterium]